MAARQRKNKLKQAEINDRDNYTDALGIPVLLRMPVVTSQSLPLKNFGEVSKNTLDNIKVQAQNKIDDIVFKNFMEEVKYRIYMIIDSITEKIALENVLSMAKTIQEKIKAKDDIVQLVKLMESTTLSIIENIINRKNIDVVLTRINFIKELLEKTEDMDLSFMPVYNETITTLIVEMVNALTSRESIDLIISYVKDTSKYINSYVAAIGPLPEKNRIIVEILNRCETLTISIVQNIIDKADINIIITRTKYLKSVIDSVKNM